MPEAPKKPKPRAGVVIYGLIDPRDGALRYIGKANCEKRRLASHMRDARRLDSPVHRWIRKLAADGSYPSVRVIHACGDSEDWREAERAAISEAKSAGVRLLNVAEGGDEPHCSIETRRENGRKSAMLATPKSVLRSIQILGRAAKDAQDEGDAKLARYYRGTVRLIREAVTECRKNGSLELLGERFAQSRARRLSSPMNSRTPSSPA